MLLSTVIWLASDLDNGPVLLQSLHVNIATVHHVTDNDGWSKQDENEVLPTSLLVCVGGDGYSVAAKV